MGVQSSAGTKGNTYMTFDVVDPYSSSMAEGKWLRSHGFQCLACCFGGCSYFTLPWVEWAKSLMTAGQQFSWYRHSSEAAAREGVCGAREAGMHARSQEHTKERV